MSEIAHQFPPDDADLLAILRFPLVSTYAMYRALSGDVCMTHGVHTCIDGDGRPATSVFSVHAAGAPIEEKKLTITMRPTRQKPPVKYFFTPASAKVGLSVTGAKRDTES